MYNQQSQTNNDISNEAQQNLTGFFNLLLQIDMRNNPHLYKKEYDRHSDINSAKTSNNGTTQKDER